MFGTTPVSWCFSTDPGDFANSQVYRGNIATYLLTPMLSFAAFIPWLSHKNHQSKANIVMGFGWCAMVPVYSTQQVCVRPTSNTEPGKQWAVFPITIMDNRGQLMPLPQVSRVVPMCSWGSNHVGLVFLKLGSDVKAVCHTLSLVILPGDGIGFWFRKSDTNKELPRA